MHKNDYYTSSRNAGLELVNLPLSINGNRWYSMISMANSGRVKRVLYVA
jgi:hypothetical protein